MSFVICGLPIETFQPLFALDDAELVRRGARRVVADASPGYPCRVTLEDAAPGEALILVNYVHQPADTPFRASHAVYVRTSAQRSAAHVDDVPLVLRRRTLSLRAFDSAGMLVDAELVEGAQLEGLAERLLASPSTAYLHVHYAKPGCYAARIDRIVERAPGRSPCAPSGQTVADVARAGSETGSRTFSQR
jgi:hypothetical protein